MREVLVWSVSISPRWRPPKRPVADRLGAVSALWLAGVLTVGSVGMAGASPSPVTMNGVPEQVRPTVPEVGLGSFTMPTGTTSIMPGSGTGGTGTDTGSGADGASLSGAAYDTMMEQSWGALASTNSQTIGVNPTAVAATCVLESGCSNSDASGDIRGAFQMMGSTYTSSLNAALQAHPELAANITPGLAGQNDPATQAIAAAQYLKTSAQQLQAAGISDPTVLDVRGSYNFGPTNGYLIARAPGTSLMDNVVQGLSPATLAANGISSTTTVQQWRDSVSAKIGSAATQPVLIGA